MSMLGLLVFIAAIGKCAVAVVDLPRIEASMNVNAQAASTYAYIKAARTPEADEIDDFALFAERPAPSPRNIGDADVVSDAQWALSKLQNMSDSGIFKTLSIARVVSASWQTGVFHNNTILELDFASPALLDGDLASRHTVVVMVDLEDGVRSLAIDEFPIMEPDAVELAWRQKVEFSGLARALELRKLDWEAARWHERQVRTGKENACVELCEERQDAIENFQFQPDAELLAIEAEKAELERQMNIGPDLSAFLAARPRTSAGAIKIREDGTQSDERV